MIPILVFPTQAYFSKQFKTIMGSRPRKYRAASHKEIFYLLIISENILLQIPYPVPVPWFQDIFRFYHGLPYK